MLASYVTRSVLITRAEADSEDTAQALRQRGYDPVAAPFFRAAVRSVTVPPSVQAVLVTSRNALPALQPSATRLLAVGDATAGRARAQGFGQVESAAGDAADLAALASARLATAGGPLFLATGAGQGGVLAADLRARGFRVIRRVCYAIQPVRRFPDRARTAIMSGELQAALFLSAETAACFVRLLPPECNDMLASVKALAIGKTTSDALGGLPWLAVSRAATPTLDGVLALL